MRHIDFKALDVFLQVMRYRSIGSAATALGMRQPTVAYAIRKLREVTGDDLFLERRGSLIPTERGLKLEKAASGMLESWQGLVQHSRQAPRALAPRRTIRIGLSMALGDPALTQILARLSAALPDLHIASSVIDNGGQVGKALKKGQIDCAVSVDGMLSVEGVMAEHVLRAQRALIRLASTQAWRDDTREHWTLLSDDANAESPVRRYLSGLTESVRLTVAPSWNGQMALWRSRGGVTPVLKFNVPWIDGANAAYVTEVPEAFPAWANISLFYLAGHGNASWIDAVRCELLTVLRGIAAAGVPLPANDAEVRLVNAG